MESLRTKAMIAQLVEKLANNGSWCGETHIQKTVYFLQHLFECGMEYDFILYKHGPFSFELRDILTEMRADELLEVQVRPYPYGPSIHPGPLAKELVKRFPKTTREWEPALNGLANQVSAKSVAELERLATALYVLEDEGKLKEEVPERVHELKPHVSVKEAHDAVREVIRLKDLLGSAVLAQ